MLSLQCGSCKDHAFCVFLGSAYCSLQACRAGDTLAGCWANRVSAMPCMSALIDSAHGQKQLRRKVLQATTKNWCQRAAVGRRYVVFRLSCTALVTVKVARARDAQAAQAKPQSGAKKARRRKRGSAVLGGGADSQRWTTLAGPTKARKGARRWSRNMLVVQLVPAACMWCRRMRGGPVQMARSSLLPRKGSRAGAVVCRKRSPVEWLARER